MVELYGFFACCKYTTNIKKKDYIEKFIRKK